MGRLIKLWEAVVRRVVGVVGLVVAAVRETRGVAVQVQVEEEVMDGLLRRGSDAVMAKGSRCLIVVRVRVTSSSR